VRAATEREVANVGESNLPPTPPALPALPADVLANRSANTSPDTLADRGSPVAPEPTNAQEAANDAWGAVRDPIGPVRAAMAVRSRGNLVECAEQSNRAF